jgi:flagellar capping protein FliD
MDTRVTTTNSQITGSISGADFTPGSYPLVVSGGTATIDGIGMGKSGTTYTNGIGTTRGLSLNFAGTDASATVYIGRSIAQSVIDFTTEMLKTSGKIETKISTLNTGIADDDLELTKLDERMDTVRSRYVSRFSAMEAVSNQMRRTGEALTNMMDAWRSSLDN